MTKHEIPEAAVEAAARVFLENETGESVWHHTDAEDETRRRVRLILEAAAPHMHCDTSAGKYTNVRENGVT